MTTMRKSLKGLGNGVYDKVKKSARSAALSPRLARSVSASETSRRSRAVFCEKKRSGRKRGSKSPSPRRSIEFEILRDGNIANGEGLIPCSNVDRYSALSHHVSPSVESRNIGHEHRALQRARPRPDIRHGGDVRAMKKNVSDVGHAVRSHSYCGDIGVHELSTASTSLVSSRSHDESATEVRGDTFASGSAEKDEPRTCAPQMDCHPQLVT